MILPWIKIQWISDFKGYGLIATRPIPKGTITFVQDGLDIVIPNDQLDTIKSPLREQVEKYSYEDYLGNRVISWDFGKYMNHDDDANTLTTGYGFEVAVRDIAEGEEITDDYRIFSTHHDTNFSAPQKLLTFSAWPQELMDAWDQKVFAALQDISKVNQPLKDFLEDGLWNEVLALEKDKAAYKKVSDSLPLKYKVQLEGLLTGNRVI